MSAPRRLDRTLIRVSGPEARSFLQNVLTQDLNRLEAADVLYAALLSPQGKVSADMLLWADDGSVLVEADSARSVALLRRLSTYKLRAAATLEDMSDRFAIVWAQERFDGAAPDPRLTALGWRKIAPRTDADALPDGAELFERTRIAAGVPDLARDAAPEEVFAGEALLEELNGVDFQKGCFVGQENVSRMKRRATTRKKFCAIAFAGEPPAPGAPMLAGSTELGSVRTGMTGRAIALIRLDRALAALDAGQNLTAEGREIRLDPPAWLILPQGQDSPAGAPIDAPARGV